MHLVIDIRSTSPIDPILTRYASSWVDLWSARHPTDRISYMHYDHQSCPGNGRSIVVSESSWWRWHKSLSIDGVNEIFRCVNFWSYSPYDPRIVTLSHIWDHGDILYPQKRLSWIEKAMGVHKNKYNTPQDTIIVPSLSTGQETVEIQHISEDAIEIIPYITLTPGKWDRHTLTQLSISEWYWLYDGSYGSESGVIGLLKWYKDYRDKGGIYSLLLVGKQSQDQTREVSIQIQRMDLMGSVRIIGALEAESVESIYMNAKGWIYVGAYYTGWPRIELARSHHIPLLISDIPSLWDYHENAIRVHPSHLSNLGERLSELEQTKKEEMRKISNDDIIKRYEKIIALKR